MAVITQSYDIDLKPDAARPVVEISQYDTGSRAIVFTVYDGHELADLTGCTARVDGSRSDGADFSVSCSVGTGSKVSFTINQEMTSVHGLHSAELVIIGADGKPLGTQNFVLHVEPSPMNRATAASPDDRTLFDQYTDSVSARFDYLAKTLTDKTDALNNTVNNINGLVGASSKPITIYDGAVTLTGTDDVEHLVVTYDPITGVVHAWATGDVGIADQSDKTDFVLCEIPSEYCPDAAYFNGQDDYFVFVDNMREIMAGNSDNNYLAYYLSKKSDDACNLCFRLAQPISQHEAVYQISLNASWYARGGKYIGVTPIPSGGGSGYTLPPATATTLGGVKVGNGLAVTDDGTLSDDHSGAGTKSIAIGVNAKSAGSGSTALGQDSNAGGNASVAIGGGSTFDSTSLAVLMGAKAVGEQSIAIGLNSKASSDYNVAIGFVAVTKGSNSTAIGHGANTKAAYSVAVGYNSTADESNTFAVGSPSLLRRVVNVKEPIKDTDAATKAYVDTLIAKLKSDNNLK